MTPQAALHDPIFRSYVILVIGSLVAGGIVLSIIHFAFKKELGSIWITYRSWLIIAPLAVIVTFAGRVPVIVGVALLAIFAFKELAGAYGLSGDWWTTIPVYAGIVTVAAASVMQNGRWLFVALPVFIFLVLLAPIARNRARGELPNIAVSLIAFICIGWMFGHLGFLANATNAYGLLGYLIFATELNDVAAFIFGKLFGRHLLRSEISPAKTLEGATGAFVVSMVLPWLLRFSFPFFGTQELVLTGLIVGIGAPLGDLTISLLKRNVGAKDMGKAIPGHGGILDRIDSLIYVAPLFIHMVDRYHGLQ